MDYNELKNFAYYMPELQKIAKSLHKQDENACNYGLTERQEKTVERLEKRAETIANTYFGLHAYHQCDPRGGTLYLLNEEDKKSGQYTNGIFID